MESEAITHNSRSLTPVRQSRATGFGMTPFEARARVAEVSATRPES
jgi:hypothetical protein